MGALADRGSLIDLEGIGVDNCRCPGYAACNSARAGMHRRSRSTAMTRGSGVEQRVGQTSWTRADFIDTLSRQGPGNGSDARQQLSVEDEILAQSLAGLSPCRAMTSRSGSGVPLNAIGPDATRIPPPSGSRPPSAGDRRGPPCNIESRPMIRCGPDDRQAERNVDAVLEMKRLDRDKRLVVVHAKRGIIVERAAAWNIVSAGSGPGDSPAFRCEAAMAGSMMLNFLAPKLPAFPRVRIKAANGEAGLGDSEIALEPPKGRSAPRFDQRAGQAIGNIPQATGAW